MIRVKLQDAMIRVGGNFQEQKGRIKGSGARWNPTTKVWESTRLLKDWLITPYDIEQGAESGDHVTRYGTHYSGAEWSYLKGVQEVTATVAQTFHPRREGLKQALREQLSAIGLPAEAVSFVSRAIEQARLASYEDVGRLQYSTVERGGQIHRIDEHYWEALHELTMDEMDAQAAAEERLADHLGLE